MNKLESSGTANIPAERLFSVVSDADLVAARGGVRAFAAQVGFAAADLVFVTSAVTEILRSLPNKAALESYGSRHVTVSQIEKDSRRGLQIVVRDGGTARGTRTADDGSSSADRLGLGVPGSRRLVDEFQIESDAKAGVTVTMRKWLA